jgi:raffinose/stachyose/melibiose transport system substrate-binding protein
MSRAAARACIAFTATVGLAFVGACAPGSDESSSTPEVKPSDVSTDVASLGNVTLKIWDQEVRGGQAAAIEKINATFQDKYPNITIDRTAKSFDDLRKTLSLAITDNDPPDLVEANNGRSDMGAFVAAGLLLPLDSYADAYGWTDRIPASVRALATYSDDGKTFGQGSLYGLSQVGEVVGVYYNKAKLSDLGLQPPKTLDEFEAALAKAKQAGEIPIQFGDLDGWPGIHEFGFLQNQYVPRDQIHDLAFGIPGAAWTSPENTDAAKTLDSWVNDGYFTPGAVGLGYDPAWQAFGKGQGVFLISGTWLAADLVNTPLGNGFGFMLPPVGPSGELTVTGGTGLPFSITAASDKADAAAAYINFIVSPEAMKIVADTGGLPVVDTDKQQVSGPQADLFAAWSQATGQNALVPYLDYATPDFYDLLTADVQKLIGGKVDPDTFLSDLQSEYTSFTSGG